MNGKIGLLGGLLAAQLLIIAGILVSGAAGSGTDAQRFLAFDPAEVAKITISDADGSVVLVRAADEAEDAGWQLEGGLPASSSKVNGVLDKLADMAAPWPVATSSDSAQRFEVTAQAHQRRLLIEDGSGVVADLFLGTSPGYRRVHARVEGESDVYSIDFSNYETPAETDPWLDKALLATPGQPSSIQLEGAWHLARGEEDQWLLDEAPADADAAEKLVRRFTDLQVLGMADATGEQKGAFVLADEQGEHRLTLFSDDDEDDYSIASSRIEGRFEIATYIAEQMLLDSSDLLPNEEGDAGGGAATDSGEATDVAEKIDSGEAA